MNIKIPKNFFGEEIELTVFISEAQLQNKTLVKSTVNILKIQVYSIYIRMNWQ